MANSWLVSGLVTALLGMTVPGCHMLSFVDGIKGSGQAETEKRSVGDFREVDLSGAVQFELTLGSAPSLDVTTDDNLLPIVKTEVKDGRLHVFTTESHSTKMGVKIKATTNTISHLTASGATQAKVNGITGKDLTLKFSGASQATLSGTAEQVKMEVSGASQVRAADLRTQFMNVDLSGASQANVFVTTSLKVDAMGASSLRYQGNPASVEKSISGASSVAPKQ